MGVWASRADARSKRRQYAGSAGGSRGRTTAGLGDADNAFERLPCGFGAIAKDGTG